MAYALPEPQAFLQPLFYVSSSEYRVFWLYLLASAALAGWVYHRQGKSIKNGLAFLCSKQFWANPSVLLDFKLILVNHWFWLLTIGPFFMSQVALALATNRWFKAVFGTGDFIQLPLIVASLIYTLLLFVLDDFSRFYIHRLYHRLPLLWRFHAVHHSATILTPFTLYRVHIVEMVINASRSLLVNGLLGGFFIYAIDGRFSKYEVLGASVFSLAFNLAGANLRHSHIWLGWGKLEKYILSPAQHQIHHSDKTEHVDKNFGVMIALWDRLFNSWVASAGQSVETVGIKSRPKQSLRKHLTGLK